MLTDTGEFCNCASYVLQDMVVQDDTSISKSDGSGIHQRNNSAVDVLGWIEIPVKIGGGGRETLAHFQVIDNYHTVSSWAYCTSRVRTPYWILIASEYRYMLTP